VLRRLADLPEGEDDNARKPRETQAETPSRAKTTLQLPTRLGLAKCTATNGRLEIRLAQDFAALDRRQVEAALLRLLDDLTSRAG
jgi:ParB family chromosome partitioning protein